MFLDEPCGRSRTGVHVAFRSDEEAPLGGGSFVVNRLTDRIYRQPVDSSSLASVGYDPTSQTLEVEFRNGGVYRYFGVPVSVCEALLSASSKGGFLVAEVRHQFPYVRVSGPPHPSLPDAYGCC